MSTTDGGPAFPIVVSEPSSEVHNGMSLRDWFAGMALESMLRVKTTMPERAGQVAAIAAYRVADAMLEARKAAT